MAYFISQFDAQIAHVSRGQTGLPFRSSGSSFDSTRSPNVLKHEENANRSILVSLRGSRLIVAGFMFLILFRRTTGSFGISIGYLYTLLIAGLWFGVKGGAGTALITIAIHLLEIAAYKHFSH